MPIGKRVCESPPVPTVSGSVRRFNQLWMTPSPGRSETPPRVVKKPPSVLCVLMSTGIGYGARQKDCITRSAEKPRQARILQFVARHRAGGVLRPDRRHSRLAVGFGTDALPSGRPQARPTIFCAKV